MAIRSKLSIMNLLKILFLGMSMTQCSSAIDFLGSKRSRRSVMEFDSIDLAPTFHRVVAEQDLGHNRRKRDVKQCGNLQTLLQPDKTYDKEHEFNETKTAIALAWAGENDGTIIIVTSHSSPLTGATIANTVFRSTNFGVTYINLTSEQNITGLIKRHNGLQRHPLDPQKVYLVGEGSFMYVTVDGGMTFRKVTLQFQVTDDLIFHSSPNLTNQLMALWNQDLYMSVDDGMTWKLVQSGVDKAVWGVPPDPEDDTPQKNPDTNTTMYFTYAQSSDDILSKHFYQLNGVKFDYTLGKSNGAAVKDILTRVVTFERQGRFLYATTVGHPVDSFNAEDDWLQMRVSTDNGETFTEVQLPTIEPEQFYSVVDIEENMIFMHVDNKGDTGHGTLYISANQGVVFYESLPKHLYPNFNPLHDFYKVQSMRGVFITSQMSDDDSIHTMISYNQGANWQKIPRPANAPCKDETKDCSLQIHGMYSMSRNIVGSLPISETTAVGIIMAHGHVADALQVTKPDVYISIDGGYSWSMTLSGPHYYQIGDHGGLLVAVSKDEPNPQIIKFSTDEGQCWHEYKFTDEKLNFTGLLTEPEGKSSVVMLWGYHSKTKKWRVHVINFRDIIKRKCGDGDYESWLSHSSHRSTEGASTAGCLLGVRETFYRLKKDSLCYNGYDHVVVNTSVPCTCTREDYECDYAYYRPGGSDDCVKEKEFKGPEIDICLHGHEEKLVSEGYRKIPGDRCKDGFKPTSKLIDLNLQCDEYGQSLVRKDETAPQTENQPNGFSKGVKVLAMVIVIAILALASVMGVYFVRKFILLRRNKTVYSYSRLGQNETHGLMHADDDDDDDEGDLSQSLDKALAASQVKYQDSDEELTTSKLPSTATKPAPKRSQPNGSAHPVPKHDTNPFTGYHDDSDDDMLS
ncbi:sortilin-like isoform X5 [Dreissena polymorpha]|uniref:sortilin-like isoform X5 n=1 Tax=Dreissena polymorpha TaxID=45954 RepID=UPI00226506D6|nr:sortilin-like isoform X5 [Dreissena polymorpha]